MKDESGIVLGIELSSRQGSVALLKDGDLLGEKSWIGERVRHNTIFQTLENLLSEAAVSYEDISLYAVGRGPGSFSGMRMSFAIAQALALPSQAAGVRGLESGGCDSKSAVGDRRSEIQINLQSSILNPQSKVCAVSSGAALAFQVARTLLSAQGGEGQTGVSAPQQIAVVGDARRGQFWMGMFCVTANGREWTQIEQTEEWKLIPYEELVIPAGTRIVSPEAERLTQYFPLRQGSGQASIGTSRFPLASDVARLALTESEPLEPLYMHPPVFVEPKYG